MHEYEGIPCYGSCFNCRNQHLKGRVFDFSRTTTAMPLMFLIGVLFMPVGIGLLATSDKIKEKTFVYSDHVNCQKCKLGLEEKMKRGLLQNCTCSIDLKLETKWSGDVYFLYGLSNFYQNNLNYVRSRDYNQLFGKLDNKTGSTTCKEYERDGNGSVYAPCGAIANSMFSDSFQLISRNYGKVPMTFKDITWKSDTNTNFKNPPGDLTNTFRYFAKPKYWQKPVYKLDEENEGNNGFLNKDLIVWMRVAAFPTFRKIYRKLLKSGGSGKFVNGLPDGYYTLFIEYNFPVESFNGKKMFIMTTSSWMGGKSRVFGLTYVIVGAMCLLFGFMFLIMNMYDHGKQFEYK